MNYRQQFTSSQSVNLPFSAQSVLIENPTGNWLYLRIGGNDIPSAAGADKVCPPFTNFSTAVSPTNNFGVAIGIQPISQPIQSPAQVATITFFDEPQPQFLSPLPVSSSLYRYREVLHDPLTLPTATTQTLTRDLSGFNNIRYSLNVVTAISGIYKIERQPFVGTKTPLAVVVFNPALSTPLGVAGTYSQQAAGVFSQVLITYQNSGGAGDIVLTDTLEAWN